MGQAKIEPTNQVEASVYVTILRLIWKIFQLLAKINYLKVTYIRVAFPD